MNRNIAAYFVPALVIQAVMIGGGFATGRELVEFFLSMGPASAFLGMAVTTALFSICAAISFVLAHHFRTYDYNSFCRLFLGPFRVIFEVGYFSGLLLVLAVVSAAAGEMLHTLVGMPRWSGSTLFMGCVGGLVYFGNTFVERFTSAWAIIFYSVYVALLIYVLNKFNVDLPQSFSAAPIQPAAAVWNGLNYAAYNIPLVAILIFVARTIPNRRHAIISGVLCGPIIMLPGFAFLLAMSVFYPEITDAPLPILAILDKIGHPSFSLVIQVVVFGALMTTGAGMLHGFNERIAHAAHARKLKLPRLFRPILALALMITATFAATAIGLIDLIGRGYRYIAIFYIVMLIFPLLTIGAWRLFKLNSLAPEGEPAQNA